MSRFTDLFQAPPVAPAAPEPVVEVVPEPVVEVVPEPVVEVVPEPVVKHKKTKTAHKTDEVQT